MSQARDPSFYDAVLSTQREVCCLASYVPFVFACPQLTALPQDDGLPSPESSAAITETLDALQVGGKVCNVCDSAVTKSA